MLEKVEAVLDKIRPALEADGGNVELVDVVDGVVKVKLVGACAGCPMSTMTLKNGIERILKREIPRNQRSSGCLKQPLSFYIQFKPNTIPLKNPSLFPSQRPCVWL
ncbi:NifU-like domain protein [Dehalococcoides mccartyi]|uniref:NifU-like domain protein n=1 Tax=Dehalococcoides mccartyi TaxID=61435 RepID=A0A328ET73_9CHLR|nr:NifU-like domain protein [Dehalococcoides mccartyi]